MTTYLCVEQSGGVFAVDMGGDTLSAMQALVDGWVDCARSVDGTMDVWVNDEGLYRGDFMVNLVASFLTGTTLVGPAVITRTTPNGETVPLLERQIQALERQGLHIFDNDGRPYSVAEILALRP